MDLEVKHEVSNVLRTKLYVHVSIYNIKEPLRTQKLEAIIHEQIQRGFLKEATETTKLLVDPNKTVMLCTLIRIRAIAGDWKRAQEILSALPESHYKKMRAEIHAIRTKSPEHTRLIAR